MNKINDRLSKIVFVQLKGEILKENFNIDEEIYMPIKMEGIIEDITKGKNVNSIPMSYFINSMFYMIGGNPNLGFSSTYVNMLKFKSDYYCKIVKKTIADAVYNDNLIDAYIYLKGLIKVQDEKENIVKILDIINEIYNKDADFYDEFCECVQIGKDYNVNKAYLYDTIQKYDSKKFDLALDAISTYIKNSEEVSDEVIDLKDKVQDSFNYEKAKEVLYDDPKQALKLLIPLLDKIENTVLVNYYIAIGYRLIENFEKAIYYLNESLNIDSSIIEVINELGLNYASLGHYDIALKYFKKAFEVVKNIEFCTNIVMCYLNLKDQENAKFYLDEAIKIDKDDDIVKQLATLINSKQ